MANKNKGIPELIRQRKIVQQYPPLPALKHSFPGVSPLGQPYFFEDQIFEDLERPIIVEGYHSGQQREDMELEVDAMEIEEPEGKIQEEEPYFQLFGERRTQTRFDSMKMLDSSSSGRQLPSRNSSVSSLSSKSENQEPNLPNFPQPGTFQEELFNKSHRNSYVQVRSSHFQQQESRRPRGRREVGSSAERQQRANKIRKIMKVGCNCKKTKCLKMYCECFNLQILCGQNCNCVDCGNCTSNENHQKAVLDALTRNPKAFVEDAQVMPTVFELGVQLSTVKKGCKCRKTQCRKKYCECFNSGQPCGIFCQCQGCGNQPVPR